MANQAVNKQFFKILSKLKAKSDPVTMVSNVQRFTKASSTVTARAQFK